MQRRLPSMVALLVLGLGLTLAAIPASASESRVGILTLPCDGTNKHLEFDASSLGNNVNRFIQGTEITALDTRGGMLYVVVRARNDEKKQLLMLGPGATRARSEFTGFFQVLTDASGNILIGTDAACTAGAPIPLVVTIYFFS